MKISVTGANGKVGHCLQQHLRNNRRDFVALTRTELDTSDAQAIDAPVAQIRPNVIINATAYTAADKAEQEQNLAYAISRDDPANMARAAKNHDAAILHISTDYIFAGDAEDGYAEEDAIGLQGTYGNSKFDGELAGAAANDSHIILRTAWVFGEHSNNFVKTIIRLDQSQRYTIDKVLSAGNTHFSQKAEAAMMNKLPSTQACIFVSHNSD